MLTKEAIKLYAKIDIPDIFDLIDMQKNDWENLQHNDEMIEQLLAEYIAYGKVVSK